MNFEKDGNNWKYSFPTFKENPKTLKEYMGNIENILAKRQIEIIFNASRIKQGKIIE